ncbi:ATPase, partial [Mycobacterium tuberculosis]
FEARLLVNLPARGRRILGHQAADTVTRDVVELARQMFLFANVDGEALADHVQLLRDQTELQGRLGEEDLLGFVGNGAVLP